MNDYHNTKSSKRNGGVVVWAGNGRRFNRKVDYCTLKIR